jgi:entericidin A
MQTANVGARGAQARLRQAWRRRIAERMQSTAAHRVRIPRRLHGRLRLMPVRAMAMPTEFTPRKERSMKRLIVLMMMAAFSTATLTACNTVAGAGKDVQKAGEKVQDKAQDCKDGKC